MASKLLLVLIIFYSALLYSTESLSDKPDKISKNYISSVLSDLFRMLSLNQKCVSKGIFECLRLKFFRAINRAVRTTDVLEVTHGVYFVKNPDVTERNTSDSRALLDTRISIGQFLVEKLREFLKTHLLQISFPVGGRSLDRIGRKKPLKKLAKGGLGLIIVALAVSGVLSAAFNVSVLVGTVVMPVILGGIAFIAVLIAKIAFVLVGVAGVRTVLSDDKPDKVKIVLKELPADHGGYGGDWEKQLQGKETSQNLAYSSYVPTEGVIQSGYYYPH